MFFMRFSFLVVPLCYSLSLRERARVRGVVNIFPLIRPSATFSLREKG
jgi:hypothetical protein